MKKDLLLTCYAASFAFITGKFLRPTFLRTKNWTKNIGKKKNVTFTMSEAKKISELTMTSDLVSIVCRVWRKYCIRGKANPSQIVAICFVLIDSEVIYYNTKPQFTRTLS